MSKLDEYDKELIIQIALGIPPERYPVVCRRNDGAYMKKGYVADFVDALHITHARLLAKEMDAEIAWPYDNEDHVTMTWIDRTWSDYCSDTT